MKINLQRTITSLTTVLDLVGTDEFHHGKRVALMAAKIAEEMNWSPARCEKMLCAGMILDCGVSRAQEHRAITETLEWEGAQNHCQRGADYLAACPPLAQYADVVLRHHTRWETLLQEDLEDDLRIEANLLFLADRADFLLAPYFIGASLKNDILWEYPDLVERIAGLAGTLFAPQLVEAFRRTALRESFWLSMDPAYIEDHIEDYLCRGDPVDIGTSEALAIAGLFARVVDAKSIYTLEHSTRVARIARLLAEACGIRAEQLDCVEIAALLHDIGKLHVPEEILDKPGPLTREERAYVMRHSYDSGHILGKVFPGQPIAEWASMHHENLLGTGYPFRSQSSDIPREARLIAVADIFQALSQERPYRGHMAKSEVISRIDRLCEQGRIDPDMVKLLHSQFDRCYALATEPEQPSPNG
ncbi:HD domain-containing phosphohydrolase [Propionivibrio sp.]|uniref:HD-GYP domain-containing protein n=1 Tax=Propionivibrio sp. TaxID=2212460 RepID=UPI0026273095|nr:HD domain-containing phosphohydrolase [Propionivibrio sp.]